MLVTVVVDPVQLLMDIGMDLLSYKNAKYSKFAN